jgi:hypothetical protein
MSSFEQAESLSGLDLITSEIKSADLGKSDRETLIAGFRAAKARIEAGQ